MSAQLGDVVRCDDDVIYEVVGLAPPTVILRQVGGIACPTCGSLRDRHYVEGSLNWQNEVQPVSTIGAQLPRCYECGDPVAEGAGERHSRAGWVHYQCIPEALAPLPPKDRNQSAGVPYPATDDEADRLRRTFVYQQHSLHLALKGFGAAVVAAFRREAS